MSIRPWLFVVLRLGAAVFALLTWAYGVATYSPFAFEMFIRPRLVTSLSDFVAWHHALYWVAYLAAAVTLFDDVRASTTVSNARTSRWMAVTWLLAFAVVGAWLTRSPYLPRLENNRWSLVAAYIALTPLIALAALDHVRAWPAVHHRVAVLPLRRLLCACLGAAAFVWLSSLAASVMRTTVLESLPIAVAAWGWSLVLNVIIGLVVYLVLLLITSLETFPRPRPALAHAAGVAAVGVVVTEFLRRIALPTISFDPEAGAMLSAYSGFVAAIVWSGLSLRRAAARPVPRSTVDRLFWTVGPWPAAAMLVVALAALMPLLTATERIDWAYVLQRFIVVAMWGLALTLFLSLLREEREVERHQVRRWTLVVAPLLAALALGWSVPLALAHAARSTGDPRLGPSSIADQQAPIDVSFRVAMGLLKLDGIDLASFRQRVLAYTAAADQGTGAPSPVSASAPETTAPRPPHVFLFIIDSLRRDYLGTYNPAIAFTPAIDAFARESYVFRNAFTRYGGTWLAMPSIWVGGPVTHRWGDSRFPQMNALEQLVRREGYRFLINDFTVAMHVRGDTPMTRLDPSVESVDTDLCRLVPALAPELDRAQRGAGPMLALLAPMNVHILNTRAPGEERYTPRYPGVYAPYASRLERLDRCFGEFVQDLKRRELYDDSVIILTADHGDSLGEHGQWGHQRFMWPEEIRIPLVIHLPARLQPTVTTDLERLSFSTDITPTLYALAGRKDFTAAGDYGASLFVAPDATLASRREESYLLISSYGPVYAMLRNNGKALYVSDLVDGREYGFDLHQGLLGTAVPVDEQMRRASQRLIEEHLQRLGALYH